MEICKKNPVSLNNFKLILPMLPDSLPDDEKAMYTYITMNLKSTGGADGNGKYKKHLAIYEEGTPQEWNGTQRAFSEVWTQNSIESPADRAVIVRTILKEISLMQP